MRMVLPLALAVVVGVAGSAARADWRLVGIDLKETAKLTVNEFSLGEGLSVTTESGELVRKAARDVVSLTSSAEKKEEKEGWVMTLRNRDVLIGSPGEATESSVGFTVAELGAVEVPLKDVLTLEMKGAKVAKAPVGGARDVVRLKNGDSLEGDFMSIKEGKVAVHTDAGDLSVELASVVQIATAGVVPARGLPTLSARLSLVSGSTLTTRDLRWRLNEVLLKDPAGKERKVDPAGILALEILGGRALYLTELDPSKDEQVPFMGTKWATQVNANVMGQPLHVGKQVYARGFGVHAKSTLTWELDGSYERLHLGAGVDDSSVPYGEADLSVVLDGKVLWEKKGVKAGAAAEVLDLPIAGGKKLELRADRGKRLDVQGRVDWVDVVLMRK